MTVTLMGGDMQAQGHAQLLVDVLDLKANVQAAADLARFRHSQISTSSTSRLRSTIFWARSSRPWASRQSRERPRTWAGVQVIEAVDGYYRGGSISARTARRPGGEGAHRRIAVALAAWLGLGLQLVLSID